MTDYRGPLVSLICIINIALFSSTLDQLAVPQWMDKQIEHDLSPFTDQLDPDYLEDIYQNYEKSCHVYKMEFRTGRVNVQRSTHQDHSARNMAFQPILKKIASLYRQNNLPDFTLVFCGLDMLPNELSGAPVFVETKKRSATGGILLPDRFAVFAFEFGRNQIIKGNIKYRDWSAKEEKLFFRGADTGAQLSTFEKYISYPRPKLIDLSMKYPELIDAGLSSTYFKSLEPQLKKKGFIKGFVPLKEHAKYKYLMDIVGTCSCTPRPALLLMSNSVVFRQTIDSYSYWTDCLVPYKHIIPVKEDLSDLLDQIEWAKNHDEECKQIASNATELAEELFSQEMVDLYLYTLLKRYAEKQALYH